MPLHDVKCTAAACGHVFERWFKIEDLPYPVWCPQCHATAERVFLRPPMAFIPRDIHYDSPIDGRVINSKQARLEDLARNECVEYDPGMRQDAARRRKEADESLEKAVEATVDEFIATAPTRKVEKLAEEMHAGVSLEVNRASPDPAGQ